MTEATGALPLTSDTAALVASGIISWVAVLGGAAAVLVAPRELRAGVFCFFLSTVYLLVTGSITTFTDIEHPLLAWPRAGFRGLRGAPDGLPLSALVLGPSVVCTVNLVGFLWLAWRWVRPPRPGGDNDS